MGKAYEMGTSQGGSKAYKSVLGQYLLKFVL